MEEIIVSPLISSYKYEKLEEEKGCWEVPKEIESKSSTQSRKSSTHFTNELWAQLRLGPVASS